MLKSICLLLFGVILGVLLASWNRNGFSFITASTAAPVREKSAVQLKFPLHAALYRFTLNEANMSVYREWVQWHHDQYGPMIATLEREKMYFESVFRDTLNAPGVIYWLAVNGEGGATSNTSASDIDRKHVEYMKQILVKGSRVTLKTEFTLLPSFIEESIAHHQLAEK